MARYLVIGGFLILAACGPTGQVHVERQLVCAADGTNCQTVETARQDYTATDRFWQIFLLLLLR